MSTIDFGRLLDSFGNLEKNIKSGMQDKNEKVVKIVRKRLREMEQVSHIGFHEDSNFADARFDIKYKNFVNVKTGKSYIEFRITTVDGSGKPHFIWHMVSAGRKGPKRREGKIVGSFRSGYKTAYSKKGRTSGFYTVEEFGTSLPTARTYPTDEIKSYMIFGKHTKTKRWYNYAAGEKMGGWAPREFYKKIFRSLQHEVNAEMQEEYKFNLVSTNDMLV